MRVTRAAVCVGLAVGMPLPAQEPPRDLLRVVTRVEESIGRVAADAPDAIWPAFRPDTIPRLYVMHGRGTLLAGWRGTPPQEFADVGGGFAWRAATDQSAASTSVELNGRRAAQIVVGDSVDPGQLLALAFHESFHVFERTAQRGGRRFGDGENTFLITQYPVFDAENEAAFALEGLTLQAALDAQGAGDARERALEFLAVRTARQRMLGPGLREFEVMAELNEGLAEYASLRGLQLAMADPRWGGELTSSIDRMLARLQRLTDNTRLSFRTRYYVTGSAMGLLLDRLAGDEWKRRLVDDDLEIQDALGFASGYYDREGELRESARDRRAWDSLVASATRSVMVLRAERRARADSVLSAPGLEVVVVAGGFIGMCGMDPQNMLQVDPGVFLHTRWFRPCVGSTFLGEFNAPVVHDQNAGTLSAVLGPLDGVEISGNGQPIDFAELDRMEGVEDLRITAPKATLRASRADLVRHDSVLEIVLRH